MIDGEKRNINKRKYCGNQGKRNARKNNAGTEDKDNDDVAADDADNEDDNDDDADDTDDTDDDHGDDDFTIVIITLNYYPKKKLTNAKIKLEKIRESCACGR